MAFGKRMESFIYPRKDYRIPVECCVGQIFYIYHGSTVVNVLVCPLDTIT